MSKKIFITEQDSNILTEALYVYKNNESAKLIDLQKMSVAPEKYPRHLMLMDSKEEKIQYIERLISLVKVSE